MDFVQIYLSLFVSLALFFSFFQLGHHPNVLLHGETVLQRQHCLPGDILPEPVCCSAHSHLSHGHAALQGLHCELFSSFHIQILLMFKDYLYFDTMLWIDF